MTTMKGSRSSSGHPGTTAIFIASEEARYMGYDLKHIRKHAFYNPHDDTYHFYECDKSQGKALRTFPIYDDFIRNEAAMAVALKQDQTRLKSSKQKRGSDLCSIKTTDSRDALIAHTISGPRTVNSVAKLDSYGKRTLEEFTDYTSGLSKSNDLSFMYALSKAGWIRTVMLHWGWVKPKRYDDLTELVVLLLDTSDEWAMDGAHYYKHPCGISIWVANKDYGIDIRVTGKSTFTPSPDAREYIWWAYQQKHNDGIYAARRIVDYYKDRV